MDSFDKATMKFSNLTVKSLAISSFLRAISLLATFHTVKVDGQVQLSVGDVHTCAFEATSRSLKCWGRNDFYELNTGDTSSQSTPIAVAFPGISILDGADAGGSSTCGISDDGGVKCVGRNHAGQLGNGSTISPISTATTMQTSPEKVIKVSVGPLHSCILYIGGGLACMGRNDEGQLGLGDTIGHNTPADVVLIHDAKHVEVGFLHTCVQDIEDSLLCMGGNEFGQLGLGHNIDHHTPVVVSLLGDKSVLTFAVAHYHTCVIDNDNLVQCWGHNDWGQLGIGSYTKTNSPTLVIGQGSGGAKDISAGRNHTCFIKNDGTAWCTGPNSLGSVGDGSWMHMTTPAQVKLPVSVTPVDIEVGYQYSCVSTDIINEIYCWGHGGYGQLGNGGTGNKSTPFLVQSLDWPTPAPVPATSSPTKKPTKAPTPATSSPTRKPTKAPTASTLAPTITVPNRNGWVISTTGNSTEQATSKDTILISTPFNTSNRDHAALVFEADCITPFDSDSYFTIDTTIPTSNAPDGFVQFNTTLDMNITAINSTEYWNAFTDGTRGGWVQACIETYLEFTDDPNLGNNDAVQKVTFKNNVFNISVSLTASYDVDQVSVVRKKATEEDVKTDYSEFISAYECKDTNPYAAPVTENTYNQGDEITICVTDESGGIVQVEEFVDLVVSQEGITDYNFILNSLYNPDITSVECLEGSSASERRVCFAKIRVLARFFEGAAPKDLTISGSVYVIRDGRRVRRNLRMGLPAPEKTNEDYHNTLAVVAGRRDVEEEEGSGDFKVIVSLASADDSAAAPVRNIIRGAAGGLVSMAVGAAGAILMI